MSEPVPIPQPERQRLCGVAHDALDAYGDVQYLAGLREGIRIANDRLPLERQRFPLPDLSGLPLAIGVAVARAAEGGAEVRWIEDRYAFDPTRKRYIQIEGCPRDLAALLLGENPVDSGWKVRGDTNAVLAWFPPQEHR